MVNHASSVRSDTTPSTSPPANAAAKREATSRSFKDRGSGARSRSGPGSRRFHGGPRPLQRAVHRSLADLEHVRRLRRPEAEHVPEYQRRTLPRRQFLHRRDERQRDRLLGLVSRLRADDQIRHLVQQRIRERRKPQRLAVARGLGRPRRPRPAPAAAAGRSPAARSGTGWWRFGTARYAATRAPRSHPTRAKPPAASPAARLRRPAPSRESGSSAAAAHPETGRSAHQTLGHLPPALCPAPYPSRPPLLPPVRTPIVPESHRSASARAGV